MSLPNQPGSLFARNRAEELGHDVWEHFVIPPFFDRLELAAATKPRVIVAGRGCGKTMLLRYLSHTSMFSTKRDSVPESALGHIGLYWRADTQFTHAMWRRNLPSDEWESAFNHLLAIVIGLELLGSLSSIAESKCHALNSAELATLDFHRLRHAFDETLPVRHGELITALEDKLWLFQTWVNDVRRAARPAFLPGRHFILALIRLIRLQLPSMRSAAFFVYLDEYENLLDYQKSIVHTCLKHSEAADGLIFNLAVKRGVMDAPRTVGSEALLHIHDWRYHDLEQYLLEDSFELFAAEILLLQLALNNAPTSHLPVEPSVLRDPGHLRTRATRSYKESVLVVARGIFPGQSQRDLGGAVFEDQALRDKLQTRVVGALKARGSGCKPEAFLDADFPEASVITPVLLNMRRSDPDAVAAEFAKLRLGDENKFTGRTDWIDNYFVAALLQLYGPYSRTCPFYSGFDTFCSMAHGSIRHMLELCHQAISQAVRRTGKSGVASSLDQATAAHLASSLFLEEIRKFGPFGIRLHTFVLRLGSLFALAQDRPSQSQAEVTHFSIASGSLNLTADDQVFLTEAVKWSVLFREPTTKRSGITEPQAEEYVLNPIYAPYFHISYRRRKKLKLSPEDLIVLMRGEYREFHVLMNRFSQRWRVDLSGRPTLFAHLDEAGLL